MGEKLYLIVDLGGYKVRMGIVTDKIKLVAYIEKKFINVVIKNKFNLFINGGKVIWNAKKFFDYLAEMLEELYREIDDYSKISRVYIILSGLAFTYKITKGHLEYDSSRKLNDIHIHQLIEKARKNVTYDKYKEKLTHFYVKKYILGDYKEYLIEPPINRSVLNVSCEVLYTLISNNYIEDLINFFHQTTGVKDKNIYFLSQILLASNLLTHLLPGDKDTIHIHIGHTSTDISIIQKNIIEKIICYRWSGKDINKDIVNYFGEIPIKKADELKIKEGIGYIKNVTQMDKLIYSDEFSTSRKEIKKGLLCRVIQAKLEDIFLYISSKMQSILADFPNFNLKDVYLSGGQSQLKGIETLLKEIWGCEIKKPKIDFTDLNIDINDFSGTYDFSKQEYYPFIGCLHALTDSKDTYIKPIKIGILKKIFSLLRIS